MNKNSFDSEQDQPLLLGQISKSSKRSRFWMPTILILLLSLTANVALLIKLIKAFERSNVDRLCSFHTQSFSSPVLEGMDIKYSKIHWDVNFGRETIYRADPSPEVDEAWENLGVNMGHVAIPEDRATEFGLHPGMIKIKPEQGGGVVANVEVFHQLHCLNMLRKSSHWNYDYYKPLGADEFGANATVIKNHFGHCLDIIRKQIMCVADTGLVGQWWKKGGGVEFGFSGDHMCKNFDAIKDWTEKHTIPKDSLVTMRPGDYEYDPKVDS